MKVYVVFTVARQIEGEYVFVKADRAFPTQQAAEELMHVLKAQYTKDGKAIPVAMNTEHGEVVCFCEIGAAEVELEKENDGNNNE